MKGNYFNLIISLHLAKFISLPFWMNSLSQRATLSMDIQILQLLSQGHSGKQGIGIDRFSAFMFSKVVQYVFQHYLYA